MYFLSRRLVHSSEPSDFIFRKPAQTSRFLFFPVYWSALLQFCCFVKHGSVALHPVLPPEVFSRTKSGWGAYGFKSPKAGVGERGANHLHVTLTTHITTRGLSNRSDGCSRSCTAWLLLCQTVHSPQQARIGVDHANAEVLRKLSLR